MPEAENLGLREGLDVHESICAGQFKLDLERGHITSQQLEEECIECMEARDWLMESAQRAWLLNLSLDNPGQIREELGDALAAVVELWSDQRETVSQILFLLAERAERRARAAFNATNIGRRIAA